MAITPFVKSPFGGYLGAVTGSFYRLNKAGAPVAPLADVIPSLTPDRVALDMVDSESKPTSFTISEDPMQDLSTATTNNYKNPDRLEVTGTLISSIALGLITSGGIGNLPGVPSPFRPDLLKMENIRALAEMREPVMYVSPREWMPLAFIENITPIWTPETGENIIVTITLLEARIVNPLTATSVVPDVAASNTGNNAATSMGGQSGTPQATQKITQPPAPGAAPTVIAGP